MIKDVPLPRGVIERFIKRSPTAPDMLPHQQLAGETVVDAVITFIRDKRKIPEAKIAQHNPDDPSHMTLTQEAKLAPLAPPQETLIFSAPEANFQ